MHVWLSYLSVVVLQLKHRPGHNNSILRFQALQEITDFQVTRNREYAGISTGGERLGDVEGQVAYRQHEWYRSCTKSFIRIFPGDTLHYT